MSLNYPLNPDTSFESFFLTNDADVIAAFGTTYGQNELAPLNYQKIMLACSAGTLTYAPLREIVYISDVYPYGKINDETTFNIQSINLANALTQALLYWKTDVLAIAPFQCVGGVVSKISTQILPANVDVLITPDEYIVETRLKINWLVIASKSLYA